MKSFVPWLTVLALIFLLSMFRLRALATALAIGWCLYCAYTWLRAGIRGTRR